MELRGRDVGIRHLEASDAQALLDLYSSNRAFLEPWEPIRPPSFWTLEGQRASIAGEEHDPRDARRFAFGVFATAGGDLVGRVSLFNVVRRSWQNATIGYFIAGAYNRRGYATQAVRLAVDYAFNHAGLHRVEAGAMARNRASIRVLEKAGFRREGLALRYLLINGAWEDHELYAVTVEEWPSGQGVERSSDG